MGAFRDTKLHFYSILGDKVNSYEEWMVLPKNLRAASLYITFYNEIMTAWNKTKSFYTPEEDGVSCILQYLVKNESIIADNKEKFNPRYVYRIAFNCLYCVCHDIVKDRLRWEMEISNIVGCGPSDEDEINLFDDFVGGKSSDYELEATRVKFWETISVLGDEGLKAVDYLLNGGTLRKATKASPNYDSDRLKDISISVDQLSEIVNTLKVLLAPFKEEFYNK